MKIYKNKAFGNVLAEQSHRPSFNGTEYISSVLVPASCYMVAIISLLSSFTFFILFYWIFLVSFSAV